MASGEHAVLVALRTHTNVVQAGLLALTLAPSLPIASKTSISLSTTLLVVRTPMPLSLLRAQTPERLHPPCSLFMLNSHDNKDTMTAAYLSLAPSNDSDDTMMSMRTAKTTPTTNHFLVTSAPRPHTRSEQTFIPFSRSPSRSLAAMVLVSMRQVRDEDELVRALEFLSSVPPHIHAFTRLCRRR